MAEQAVELTTDQWLKAHGYGTHPYDQCWLACPAIGFLKTYRGREIVLCLPHAQELEAGKVGGSYRAVPVPADSRAFTSVWPWRPAQPVALV